MQNLVKKVTNSSQNDKFRVFFLLIINSGQQVLASRKLKTRTKVRQKRYRIAETSRGELKFI